MASPELAYVYAALILNDDNIDITKDKIQLVLNAAGVQVESYWIDLFSEYFKMHDITKLIKGEPLGDSPSSTSISRKNEPEMTTDDHTNKKEEEEEEIPGGFDDLFG